MSQTIHNITIPTSSLVGYEISARIEHRRRTVRVEVQRFILAGDILESPLKKAILMHQFQFYAPILCQELSDLTTFTQPF